MTSEEVKIIELVPKRADLTDERFHYHWAVLHTRVARTLEPMKRYVQHHRISPGIPGVPSLPIEGVAEAAFDSLIAVQGVFDDPVFLEASLPSMRSFLDMARQSLLITKEHVVINIADEGTPSAAVILHLLKRSGLSGADFERQLRDHAQIAAKTDGLVRYAQFLPIPETVTDEENFDAVEILAWEDLDLLEAAWSSDYVQIDILNGLRAFCDLRHSGAIVTEARKIF
jgi:hypothetical protein